MNLNNTTRFTIEKDAVSFLKKENIKSLENLEIAKKSDFKFNYNWDKDFLKYMNWNFDKINEISKYYPEMELFLKNIKWESFFDKSIEKASLSILEIISRNSINKVNLSIINISSLEMIIMWKVFEDFWIKNIVYNFNRIPAVNSSSKTLEAFLFLFAYDSSPYLKQKVKKVLASLNIWNFSDDIKNQYIIFDENNSTNNYNYHKINDYLKNQIWFKEPKNVYRLDKFPDEAFLSSKNIDTIFFFDNDNDYWKIADFYKDYFSENNKKIKIVKNKYFLRTKYKDIWYYEDYLVKKDKEYMVYKTKIASKTRNTASKFTPDSNTYKPLFIAHDSSNTKNKYQTNTSSMNDEQRKKILPFLISIPVLVVLFIMTDTWFLVYNWSSWGSFVSINSWWFWWTSIWSSSASSSKSSSSIIKSFWWGWFSKWSSSS